jgi:hypothetical protein
MELANIYDENFLDSGPIRFIPFNNNENRCYYCKRSYSTTILFKQKYCEDCFSLYYIKNTINNNLDVLIDSTCNYYCKSYNRSSSNVYTHNIQERCEDCSAILFFKQIVTSKRLDYLDDDQIDDNQRLIENIKDCKLCGKLIYQLDDIDDIDYIDDIEFKLCSYCYQISSEWVESTLTKNVIPVLYLPWWDAYVYCVACNYILEFKSNCQKLCSYCRIIYTGCRYCLTTNIIIGITDQSQCKKCKKNNFYYC